ncbi:hypothetical protein [Deinococcus radiophilus]|uniref:hypothetical protein n=1 Tax=Deinococcus radiophilus TaxID=32062 RepID=UPI001E5B5539|nr:hypothetical protein [Deinococcus radiophilus]UFA49714.1 hypothetical protein LMT64_07375 [Deinococcus radiophilus]
MTRRPVPRVEMEWETPAVLAPAPHPALWPWLLSGLVSLGLLGGSLWLSRALSVPNAPATVPQCCQLTYEVRGAGRGVPVRVRALEAPPLLTLTPEQTTTAAPGTVALPGPGKYRVRVSADGYAPQTATVQVPSAAPVVLELE